MICLQTFAFVVFLGVFSIGDARHHHKTSPDGGIYYDRVKYNSFAYLQNYTLAKAHDRFSSFVVSKTTGPLCSGFHITVTLVVTTASCVYREYAKELFVISNTDPDLSSAPHFYIFRAKDRIIHPNYTPNNNYHDVAVVLVKAVATEVPSILALPPVPLPKGSDMFSTSYFYKRPINETSHIYYSVRSHVRVMPDMEKCGRNATEETPLLCILMKNPHFLGFTPMNTGAPLVLKDRERHYAYGIFSDRTFYTDKGYYIYQDVTKNLEFLKKFVLEDN